MKKLPVLCGAVALTFLSALVWAADNARFSLLAVKSRALANMPEVTKPIVVGVDETHNQIRVAMQLERDPDQAFAAMVINGKTAEQISIMFEKGYEAKLGAGAKSVDIESYGDGLFRFIFSINPQDMKRQTLVFGYLSNGTQTEKYYEFESLRDSGGLSFWYEGTLICSTDPKRKTPCYSEKGGM